MVGLYRDHGAGVLSTVWVTTPMPPLLVWAGELRGCREGGGWRRARHPQTQPTCSQQPPEGPSQRASTPTPIPWKTMAAPGHPCKTRSLPGRRTRGPGWYQSPTPTDSPPRAPRPACLHTHEVVVEVHAGSQVFVRPPAQELLDELAAVLEVIPAATPLPGLAVLQVGGLVARAALHAARAARLGQRVCQAGRGDGIEKGGLLEAWGSRGTHGP